MNPLLQQMTPLLQISTVDQTKEGKEAQEKKIHLLCQLLFLAPPQTTARQSRRKAGEIVHTAYQSIRVGAERASRSTGSQRSDVWDGRNSLNPKLSSSMIASTTAAT